MSWERVAAEGTDPALLERVVGLVARRGGSTAVGKRAAEVARTCGLEGTALLRAVAPEPSPTVRKAVAPVVTAWQALGVRAALAVDPAYPAALLGAWPDQGAPPLLAWRGSGAPPDVPAVAIVGARRATPYGTGVAAWLAETVSRAGVLVVSGGARGIDAAAHAAAAEQPGGTMVVLGCGHDVAYPRQHAQPGGLFDRVLDHGGWLVSEFLPGTEPRAHAVLARNRIVAGLSRAVVVVEGGARSGALRTAAAAADLGVPVMGVPGDVRAPNSAAPHRLLAEGAAPCTSPDDLFAALGGPAAVPSADAGATAVADHVTTLPRAVAEELGRRWPRPVPLDDLSTAAGVGAGALLAAVTRAQVAGEVVRTADGIRLSRAP